MTRKTYYIISLCLAVILGTLLHFAYDISNQNYIIGLFTPVNESVWEHLKLVMLPILILLIVTRIYKKEKIFFASFISIILGCLYIILSHYTFEALNIKSFAIDILSYIFAMIISVYIIYRSKPMNPKLDLLGIFLIFLLILVFAIFTVYPPKFEIFLDTTTNTYGIFRTKLT